MIGAIVGGNALALFGARRYDREEYLVISDEILYKLDHHMPEKSFMEIPYYRNKESFGDMDILCLPLTNKDYEYIRKVLDTDVFLVNGGVMSLLYEGLQVDIIPMPLKYFTTSYKYYAYNDLGNLLGKIFHKFGLKYGHRGLTMPLRDGTHQYAEIEVSRNLRETLEFLGLSYDKYKEGFENLEEIYEYVESSKYFSPDIYWYENLNSINKVRDRKRSTYQGFVKRNEGKEPRITFSKNKEKYLDMIFKHFPESYEKYKEARLLHLRGLNIKEKFNGVLVSEWTGLTGKELGNFMCYLKSGYNDIFWSDLNDDQIKKVVIRNYEDFKPI